MSVAVLLALAVVTAGGEAWAKNWNKKDTPVDLTKLSDPDICNGATLSGRLGWIKGPKGQPFINEAARRGLTCSLGAPPADKSVKNLTEILSSYDNKSLCDKLHNSDAIRREATRRGLSCGVAQQTKTNDEASLLSHENWAEISQILSKNKNLFMEWCREDEKDRLFKQGDYNENPFIDVLKGLDNLLGLGDVPRDNHVKQQIQRLGVNCSRLLNKGYFFSSLEFMPPNVLCKYASNDGLWETSSRFSTHVQEAKRRGLSCGVGETTQTAAATSGVLSVSNVALLTDNQICERLGRATKGLSATIGSGAKGRYEEWAPLNKNDFRQLYALLDEGYRRGLSCSNLLAYHPLLDSTVCDASTLKIRDKIYWAPLTTINASAAQIIAKMRGLDCGVTVASRNKETQIEGQNSTDLEIVISSMSQPVLCRYATRGNNWETDLRYQRHVQEAKRRGLNCGVSETTQTASAPVLKINPKVTSAALTAAEKEAERLRQELAALKAQQQQRQQTISSDTQKPTIKVAGTAMNGPQGTIKGFVRDNTGVAEVRVDGRPVEVDSYGNFTANTYVPEGGVSVSIQAIDLAGLSSSMSVRLERSASTSTASISFDRLNPLGRKVAKNNDALALIIGVDAYENTPARAIYADSDAKVFADYASQKLGIPTNRIKTLVNDGADESGMLLAVKEWLSRASKQGKSDIYVFFAGHGLASPDGKKMYLLPYDGSPRLLEKTAILRDELFSDIAAANPRSVTVFLDTCYSGETRGKEMLIAGRPIGIRVLEQSVPDNFTLMTAAAGDQIANPLREAKHGMFSYFLMKGMEGLADSNQDNKITAGELHQYVKANVVQQSSGSQTPDLQGDANRVLVQFQ